MRTILDKFIIFQVAVPLILGSEGQLRLGYDHDTCHPL